MWLATWRSPPSPRWPAHRAWGTTGKRKERADEAGFEKCYTAIISNESDPNQANPIPNPGLQNDSFKSARAVKRELFFLLLQKIGKVLSRKAKPKVDFNTSPLKNNIKIFCTVKKNILSHILSDSEKTFHSKKTQPGQPFTYIFLQINEKNFHFHKNSTWMVSPSSLSLYDGGKGGGRLGWG